MNVAGSGGEPAVMRVPVHPVLSWDAVISPSRGFAGSVLDGRSAWLLVSGRMGLVHALRAWNAARGAEVLIPAYHCLAMVTPLEWLGLKPVFYPLRADLSADTKLLSGLVTSNTCAVIGVHYFGFAYPMLELRRFCDEFRLALIEDCAHAYFTRGADGEVVGGLGDYAICSLMKFLPLFDGGALVVRAGAPRPTPQLQSAHCMYELKATVDVLERAAELGTLRGLNRSVRTLRGLKRRMRPPTVDIPAAISGGFRFDPGWLSTRPSLVSRFLTTRASPEQIAQARRYCYQELTERLAGAVDVRVLFPKLEAGAVPYVLPVVAEHGEAVFMRARGRGVQVFRWEFTEAQECSNTKFYARRLLQFPCHQGLSTRDLDLIAACIRGSE
jgi:perosamine synthetase